VRENFHRIIPLLQAAGHHIAIVDGAASVDAVHEAIVAQVRSL